MYSKLNENWWSPFLMKKNILFVQNFAQIESTFKILLIAQSTVYQLYRVKLLSQGLIVSKVKIFLMLSVK